MSNLALKETKEFFSKDSVKKKFEELLGKKSQGFVTSVMQVVSNNKLLQNASKDSIYSAAMMGATLDLPINNNLGFAWIVPYGGSAQFQMGWKGYVQLAQRTGQYKAINVIEVYENQFKSYNRLSEELEADFTLDGSGEVVGYVAYFKLINGFEKTSFWSKNEVENHAKKFSKTYNHSTSVWKTDFNSMAKKTVLKNTLAKWGVLSIEMQNAVIADQAVIKDVETMEVEYEDAGEAVELKTIPNDSINDIILQIKAGNVTLEALQKKYDISEQQLKLIENGIKN